MKSYLLKSLITVILLSGTTFLSLTQAQTIPSSCSANGSDYFVTLTWSSFNGDIGCDYGGGCSVNYDNRREWYFYKGSGSEPNGCWNSGDAQSDYSNGGYSDGGGSYTFTVGPDVNQKYTMRYQQSYDVVNFIGCVNDCREWRWTGCFTESTAHIKPPVNVVASEQLTYTTISVTWDKGSSDIPDSQLRYRVYKDGNLVFTTTADGERNWTDTGMNPNETHTYCVRSVYTPNGQESYSWASPCDQGTTKVFALDATDFVYPNRTKLSWPNVSSFADEIRVYRGTEELIILSDNATSYNDYDGIPGYVYTYKIEPLDANGNPFPQYSDAGSRKANGKISGDVKTPFNAGVPGVIVTAEATIQSVLYTYSDTTDASGYYEIKPVYYYEEADYTITPSKPGHGFNPDEATRTLDLSTPSVSNVNFTDTTVFSVLGTVHFPVITPGDTCFIAGVDILVDGNPTGVQTNSQGRFSLGIQEPGNHTITPKYHHHTFNPPSYTLNVNDNFFGQNFVNTTTDTLIIKVKGGCDNIISDSAQVRLSATDPGVCFSQTIYTTASGTSTLVLPAREYRVEVLQVLTGGQNNQNILSYFDQIIVDLTERDSAVSSVDSTQMIAIVPKADFIYHSNIVVDINGLPDPVCGPSGTIYVLEQDENTLLEIEVLESHIYDNDTTTCHVDTGFVVINDDVSDAQSIQLDLIDGRRIYTMQPGVPNITGGGAHPYQKLLEVYAEVGFSQPVTSQSYILVKGHRPRTQTFVTRTPELPFFILHDPPGDASYSFLQEDSTFSYAYSNQVQLGGGAGIYANVNIGAGVPIPFTGIVIGASVNIEASAIAGRDNLDRQAAVTTFTATELFSTSAAEDFISGSGDVFVGASFNMIYALTDVIDYDEANCTVVRDTQLVWGANDIATNYIYTEDHIRNTLLPQLDLLRSLANGDSVLLIQSYIDVWEQVLAKNELNKQNAEQIENVSFSGGAVYENSVTTANDTAFSIEYNIFIETEVAIGIGVGDGGTFANTELGVKTNFNWSTTRTDETTITNSKTVGYHLEDDDAGDFFSVDIKKDKVYGTPVFAISAATSSCPHEEGTQPRDVPQITLDGYIQTNVPQNEPAVFVANLGNISESGETREYSVQSVTTSNLDGAIIKLGGQVITTVPVSYNIPSNQSIPVALSVERGPLANDYEDLQVVMYPGCDAGEADTVTFSVYFQNMCSEVSLYQPYNNWLVNQQNNNNLYVVFTGYNVNDPNLIDIRLQYRKIGQGWETATVVPSSSLTEQYYNFNFDVTGLTDGSYELRGVANCGAQVGLNYSPVVSGIIDRNSITLFGNPTPTDGVLNLDEVVSVTFNEDIDCNLIYDPVDIMLTRADNGQTIPVTFVCNGDQIIINTNPSTLIDSLENVLVHASVDNLQDVNGNILQSPIVWSFVVNRSPVFWEPSNVVTSTVENVGTSFTANLRNVSGISHSFSLVYVPAWLSPATTNGTVPPSGLVPVDFTVSSSLEQGVYIDTVIADINGVQQLLYVNLNVNAVPPNWSVDPSDFQYSMTVVSQFSIDQNNAPLSADTRDKIGAFYGEECRGVASIQYVPALNKYAAFLTIYSNTAVGENIDFRFWDAVPGTEYAAVETMAFISDQNIGQPLAPYVLHPAGIFQTIPLTQGWNWFSVNVSNTDMSIETITSTLEPEEGDVLKTQGKYTQYSVSDGWQGALDSLNNKEAYMMYLAEADTLRFFGSTLPDNFQTPIRQGWNWIGYPRHTIADAAIVLDNYAASDGDIIKNESQFASYNAASDVWAGNLESFKPGKGYKLNAQNPGVITYSGYASIEQDCANGFLFENNMTVTAQLLNNGEPLEDSHFIVAAFINDSCRGYGQPEFLNNAGEYRNFITVPGFVSNIGSNIEFRVEDIETGMVYFPEYNPIIFDVDDISGTIDEPVLLNIITTGINDLNLFNGYSLSQNYPNPYNSMTTIEFTIPVDEDITLEVFNLVGERNMTLINSRKSAGAHKVSFDASGLAQGIYLYRLVAGDYSKTLRMTVVK